jgi:hypothetical protein
LRIQAGQNGNPEIGDSRKLISFIAGDIREILPESRKRVKLQACP